MVLSEKEARLVRFFAACVLGRWEQVRELRLGAPPGEPDREWREALLQVHVFAGFPRAVEASEVLLALGSLGPLDPDEATSRAGSGAGRALFERIYQDQSARVEDFLQRSHPLLASWIFDHAYGRVLAREGLTPRQRELLAVAALACMAQDKQLASHVRGALRCGAQASEPAAVWDLVEAWIPADFRQRGRQIVDHYSRRQS